MSECKKIVKKETKKLGHQQIAVEHIDLLKAKYHQVLTSNLGCVSHYAPPLMKFKSRVPENGGMQTNFSQDMLHVVKKRVT